MNALVLYPIDPIAWAWAACHPGKQPPAELECRPLPSAEEVQAEEAARVELRRRYQREAQARWRRRRAQSVAGAVS
jgi:hypothetical protein